MLTNQEFDLAMHAASQAYKLDSGGGYLPEDSGYTLVTGQKENGEVFNGRFLDEGTGLKAGLYTDGAGNYLLSFCGTEGGQDWYQNLSNMGYGQWESGVNEIRYQIQKAQIKERELGSEIQKLTITGHSLGGGLAQYAAYDLVERSVIDPSKLDLVTFNGLGGVSALEKEYDTDYNENMLVGANVHHYFEPSDLVVRVSEHLGDGNPSTNNNYQLIADTNAQFFLDAHDMNTILTQRSSGDIQVNTTGSHDYYKLDDVLPIIQKLSGATNGLFGGGEYDVSQQEATARLYAVLPGIFLVDGFILSPKGYSDLKDFVIDNLLETQAGITNETDRQLMVFSLGKAVSALSSTLTRTGITTAVAAITQGASLLLDGMFTLFPDSDTSSPTKDALFHAIFRTLHGATINHDGVLDGGYIRLDTLTDILDDAAQSEVDRYSSVIGHLGNILGLTVEDSLIGHISFFEHLLKEGVAFSRVGESRGVSKEWDFYNGQPEIDARIVRYSIIHNVPFILGGPVNEANVSTEIRTSERYAEDTYSDQYWKDRYDFHRLFLDQNRVNEPFHDYSNYVTSTFFHNVNPGENVLYEDLASVDVAKNYSAANEVSVRRFGTEDNDTTSLNGGDYNDFLYGEGGNDIIHGNAGRDHLEGQADNDTLHGGADTDYLYGGKGNDHLYGGTGYDFLYGGEGSDTYYYVNGDGHDSISDIDAGDRLSINGHIIADITQSAAGSDAYKDDFGNIYHIDQYGSMLISISNGGAQTGTITIDQFDENTNNFGITVNEPEEPSVPELVGDVLTVGGGTLGDVRIKDDYYNRANDPDQLHINDQSIIYDAVMATGITPYTDSSINYHFHGGNQNDELAGGHLRDRLWGFAGDDKIDGGASDDQIRGGAGNDQIKGGDGHDLIWGNEQLFVDALNNPIGVYEVEDAESQDIIDGGSGHDHISADGGNDIVTGGVGNDVIAGGLGSDTLMGGAGSDFILGDSQRDYQLITAVTATTKTHYIDTKEEGQTYNDIIDGGEGEDHLLGGLGNDTVLGGEGNDWIHGDRHNQAESLVINDQIDEQFQLLDPELHGNDVLMGGGGEDRIFGDAGDDYLDGGAENDTMWGDDIYIAGEYHGKDVLVGGTGNDAAIGGGNDDLIYGGEGNDVLIGDESIYDDETEILLAGQYHGNDEIHGGVGNDDIVGGGKDDVLYGGEDDDYIWGDSKFTSEQIFDAGKEVPIANSAWWLDTAHHGQDLIYAGSGDDRVYGGGASDTVYGGAGSDSILGQDGHDTLHGEAGNDLLFGGDGSDILYGGSGDDSLSGGAGDDTLHAGSGQDYLDGDAGNDTYVFNTGDGSSTIDDTEGQTALVFNSIQASSEIKVYAGEDYAVVQYGQDVNDKVFLTHETYLNLTGITLADGSTLDSNPIQLVAIDESREITGTHGNDTFQMNAGFGAMTLVNNGDTSTIDTLKFGEGITPENIQLEYHYQFSGAPTDISPDAHTVRVITESGDALTLKNFIQESDTAAIDFFEFSNGDVWDLAEFKQQLFTGTDESESIGGTPFDDVISGGKGDDYLNGYGGNDTYRFNRGDGHDTIGTTTGGSFINDERVIELGPDIMPDDIVFVHTPRELNAYYNRDNLDIYLKDTNDRLSVKWYFDNSSVYRDFSISFLSTGETLTWLDILNGVQISDYDDRIDGLYDSSDEVLSGLGGNDLIYGYSGNDTLNGDEGDDRLWGGRGQDTLTGGVGHDLLFGEEGSDTLEGGSGNDSLEGGQGDDVLIGGVGDDFYSFDDGFDTVSDESGIDTLSLRLQANESLSYNRDGTNLQVQFGVENQVTVENFFAFDGSQWHLGAGAIEEFRFTNSESKTAEQIFHIALNVAPEVGVPIEDQSSLENEAFSFTVPGNTFFDSDADSLSYSAMLSDGSALPGWLNFNGTTFSGTPDNSDVGSLAIQVTASDGLASVSTDFNLTVTNVNNAPVVEQGISDLSIYEEQSLNLAIPVDAFSDLDGDILTYTATLSDGSVLPAWLSFDGTAFTGTPGINEYGNLIIEVTASDGQATTTTHFNLTVTHTNNAPALSLSLADQSGTENEMFSFTLPDDSFTDIDAGDSLSYYATLSGGSPLPAWLSFDADSLTFSGTPGTSDSGSLNIEIIATDLAGASASDVFELIISEAEPEQPDESVPVVASGAVIFVGTNADDVAGGSHAADSLDGQRGNDTLYGFGGDDELKGYIGNDRMIGGTGNDTMNGSIGSDTYVFNLGDGQDTIAEYRSASDMNVIEFGEGITPDDLSFRKSSNGISLEIVVGSGGDLITLQYYYSSPDDLNNTLINEMRFDDGTVLSQVDLVSLIPVLVTEGNDWIYGDGGQNNLAGMGGNDILWARAGDDILDGGAGNDGLYGNEGNDTLTGGLGNDILKGDLGNDTYVYNTGDGLDTIYDTEGMNHLIIDGQTISQLTRTLADPFVYEDQAGNTYHISEANGSLKVTVGAGGESEGSINLRNWNQDTNNFGLTLQAAPNQAPVIDQGITDAVVAEDAAFSLVIPMDAFADLEGDMLSYSATLADGEPLPEWLGFDGTTFTGVPTNDEVGSLQIEVSASDGQSSVATVFNLSVANVNDAPVLSSALVDQNTTEGQAFSFGLPEDSFTDVDAGDSLSYSALLSDGSALPDWLNFDASTRVFSGTPITAESGLLNIEVQASDLEGLVASDNFELEIASMADQPMNLTGSNAAEIFEGGNSDDYISAKGGADQLYGFEGEDTLIGGGGSDQLYGGAGNDVLKGNNGADQLYGAEGNDILVGGKGNDTYHFASGDEYDKINNASNNFAAETDVLSLEGLISEEDVWFKKTNNHLDIYLLGSEDHVRVNNWYKAEKFVLDRIDTGTSSIDAAGIEQLVSAMASFGAPSGGAVNLSIEEQQYVSTAVAAAWQ